MNRARAALAGARVSEAIVEGAFNDVALVLPKPEGTVPLRFRGAFNNFRVVVPRGTVVHVRRDGPLNVLERGGASSAGEPEGPVYDLRIDGAFNHLSVDES
jgi:hypothetical protein